MKSFIQYVIETRAKNLITLDSTRESSARAAFLARQKEIQQGILTRSKTWSGSGKRTTKQMRQDWKLGRDRN